MKIHAQKDKEVLEYIIYKEDIKEKLNKEVKKLWKYTYKAVKKL